MTDTSDDDKRIYEALMTCCQAPKGMQRLLEIWRPDNRGDWIGEVWGDGGRGEYDLLAEVTAASPEGALIALAKELKG